MPKSEGSTSYAVPAGAVFNAAAQAVQNLPGWKLRGLNQQGWYIAAAVAFSFWSYGENISIQVSEPSPGQPMLGISSSSVFALFDFGRNKKNVNKFFAEVQNVQAQAGYAPAAAPAQEQVPVGSYSPNYQLRPGARFCTDCGQLMPGR